MLPERSSIKIWGIHSKSVIIIKSSSSSSNAYANVCKHYVDKNTHHISSYNGIRCVRRGWGDEGHKVSLLLLLSLLHETRPADGRRVGRVLDVEEGVDTGAWLGL